VWPPRTTIQSWFPHFGLGHKSQTIVQLAPYVLLLCCIVLGVCPEFQTGRALVPSPSYSGTTNDGADDWGAHLDESLFGQRSSERVAFPLTHIGLINSPVQDMMRNCGLNLLRGVLGRKGTGICVLLIVLSRLNVNHQPQLG